MAGQGLDCRTTGEHQPGQPGAWSAIAILHPGKHLDRTWSEGVAREGPAALVLSLDTLMLLHSLLSVRGRAGHFALTHFALWTNSRYRYRLLESRSHWRREGMQWRIRTVRREHSCRGQGQPQICIARRRILVCEHTADVDRAAAFVGSQHVKIRSTHATHDARLAKILRKLQTRHLVSRRTRLSHSRHGTRACLVPARCTFRQIMQQFGFGVHLPLPGQHISIAQLCVFSRSIDNDNRVKAQDADLLLAGLS
jgi:hypothetical protein